MGPYEMWKMSVKNGYIHDYDNFYQGVGSVVCVDVAKDLVRKYISRNSQLPIRVLLLVVGWFDEF